MNDSMTRSESDCEKCQYLVLVCMFHPQYFIQSLNGFTCKANHREDSFVSCRNLKPHPFHSLTNLTLASHFRAHAPSSSAQVCFVALSAESLSCTVCCPTHENAVGFFRFIVLVGVFLRHGISPPFLSFLSVHRTFQLLS